MEEAIKLAALVADLNPTDRDTFDRHLEIYDLLNDPRYQQIIMSISKLKGEQ